jgi:hypothetical protein
MKRGSPAAPSFETAAVVECAACEFFSKQLCHPACLQMNGKRHQTAHQSSPFQRGTHNPTQWQLHKPISRIRPHAASDQQSCRANYSISHAQQGFGQATVVGYVRESVRGEKRVLGSLVFSSIFRIFFNLFQSSAGTFQVKSSQVNQSPFVVRLFATSCFFHEHAALVRTTFRAIIFCGLLFLSPTHTQTHTQTHTRAASRVARFYQHDATTSSETEATFP